MTAFSQSSESRLIGRCKGKFEGPLFIIVVGMHGNEPAGISAVKNILSVLKNHTQVFRGQIAAFYGNMTALKKNVRFIDRDLNRHWSQDKITSEISQIESIEDKEMHQLGRLLETELQGQTEPVYFFDLHTFASQGIPFCCIGDTLSNRNFALKFPIPIIMGLEESLEYSLLEYMNNKECISLGFEGGNHLAENSGKILESALWLAFKYAGAIKQKDFPQLKSHYKNLESACKNAPKIVEIKYRQEICSEHRFKMKQGYNNFQYIDLNHHLADDSDGEIRSPMKGRILLPLYQGLGEDGFFIGQDLSKIKLWLSTIFRRWGMERILPFLPGVHIQPGSRRNLVINTDIAFAKTIDIFFLFGYRKLRQVGKHTFLATRRRHFN